MCGRPDFKGVCEKVIGEVERKVRKEKRGGKGDGRSDKGGRWELHESGEEEVWQGQEGRRKGRVVKRRWEWRKGEEKGEGRSDKGEG